MPPLHVPYPWYSWQFTNISTFSFGFVLSNLENSKIWPLQSQCSIPNIVPNVSLNLFQHRCALLRVQRQECTESSRHGCTKVFYGILISSACPYNGPCFLGFLAAAAHEVTRKLSTLLSDCGTSTLQGLVLRRASCKLVTNSLSILYQPLLKFSHLHFLFTFHMPRFPGLPRVPCNSLLKFLIESCKGGEVCATFFYLCQTFYLGFQNCIFKPSGCLQASWFRTAHLGVFLAFFPIFVQVIFLKLTICLLYLSCIHLGVKFNYIVVATIEQLTH